MYKEIETPAVIEHATVIFDVTRLKSLYILQRSNRCTFSEPKEFVCILVELYDKADCMISCFKDWLNHIVCVEVLLPSQPNGVMSSAVSLPNHTFTGQA